MYLEDQVKIGKADDGTFIITFNVKRKPEKGSKGEMGCYAGSNEKTHTAANIDEVKSFLDEILPNIKAGAMEEDDYKASFGEAVKGEE